jgi:hypothetical protein
MNAYAQSQIARYQQLTQELIDLVPQIADAEEELSQRKLAATSERKTLDTLGDTLVDEAIARAGGVKEFGSSEDVRKKNAIRVKVQSKRYTQQEAMVEVCDVDVQRQGDLLSDLTRRYGATCHQVVHHAALLQFLGSAGAAATTGLDADVQFERPTPNGFVSNGQSVSPADAAEIGL